MIADILKGLREIALGKDHVGSPELHLLQPLLNRIPNQLACAILKCLAMETGVVFYGDEGRNNFLDRLGTILTDTKTSCFAWALIL